MKILNSTVFELRSGHLAIVELIEKDDNLMYSVWVQRVEDAHARVNAIDAPVYNGDDGYISPEEFIDLCSRTGYLDGAIMELDGVERSLE